MGRYSDLPCYKCGHLMSDVDGHRLDIKVEKPVKVAGRCCLECQQEIAKEVERRQWAIED